MWWELIVCLMQGLWLSTWKWILWQSFLQTRLRTSSKRIWYALWTIHKFCCYTHTVHVVHFCFCKIIKIIYYLSRISSLQYDCEKWSATERRWCCIWVWVLVEDCVFLSYRHISRHKLASYGTVQCPAQHIGHFGSEKVRSVLAHRSVVCCLFPMFYTLPVHHLISGRMEYKSKCMIGGWKPALRQVGIFSVTKSWSIQQC